jgi:adenosine 3'-phospho 5'-phosphosulfate transporter B2
MHHFSYDRGRNRCAYFLTRKETKSPLAGKDDTIAGVVLMVAYLFFDGFTSTLQEKMFKGYDMSTSNQMIYVNSFSAVLSLVGLLYYNQFWAAVDFASRNPGLFQDSTALSLCVTFGQQIIYTTIKKYGALLFSTVMTTRQFISIILSSILFLHSLTTPQV